VLVPFTSAGNFEVSRELRMGVSIFGTTKGLNIGGFFICEPSDYTQPTAAARITYIDMLVPYSNDGSYLVLQRDETDFHIIQQSGKPIRVDISNSSPLVTVLDNDNTFRSHYIFNNEIMTFYGSPNYTGITQPSGVRDYRYTMLEIPSGITISGVFTTMSGLETSSGVDGANKLILYAMGSGINFTYTNDLSSGYLPIYAMPSGLAERIETSNFVASGQYVFVTTSGDSPAFYQKDPMSAELIYYSGLPVSRATIIRLDDRV
jgi:hypothetical protein